MRILFLTKRHYMAKDLLLDRYGRFYHLPVALAAGGATVLVSCLSYYDDRDINDLRLNERGVEWHSRYVGRNPVTGIYRYYRMLCRLVRKEQPHLVVGASDSIHAILATKLADRFSLPCCIDLYDNFESYGQMRLPGLKPVFRQALRKADALTVVSGCLKEYVRDTVNPAGRMEVVENAIPKGLFVPMDKREARKALGLPLEARLVGTAGSLYRSRDTASLYEAFLRLAARRDDLCLVLAGGTDGRLEPPDHERVLYLGNLPYEAVPRLYAALDVGVICNRDDAFSRYCFPQKLYEMLACRLPVVAADVGVAADILGDLPACLYRPGDGGDLERALVLQLEAGRCPDVPIPDWGEQGQKLLRLLEETLAKTAP